MQNIFVERVFCSFLRWQMFWKIYSMNICWGIQLSDLSLEKGDSQTEKIKIVKSFSRPKD